METRSIAKIIVTVFFMIGSLTSKAQKKHLSNPQEVEQEVHQVLNTALNSDEGLLHKLKSKNNLKGTFVIDLTINDKSHVISVFVVENNGGTAQGQTTLKDALIDLKFKFKVPKGKRYKIRHTFIF